MRDMWEYTLNLNEDELKRLMMHIVEMEKIGSDYFFLDENCSYNLLLLLEIARPDVELSSHLIISVEPIDTLRVVLDEKMVLSREYRPSLYMQMMQKKEVLSGRELDAVVGFANGDVGIDALSAEAVAGNNTACMYDLASDYLKFLAVKDLINKENYQKRILEVLRKRSALSKEQSYSVPVVAPSPPETSHRSNKLSFSYGRYLYQNFAELTYRPTCHDLIDSDLGLAKNTEIVFGNTSVRYYTETKKVKFQRFDLLKIKAIPPSNTFYMPKCFMWYAGLQQSPVPDKQDALAGYLNFGGGYSYSFGNPFHIYALFKTDTAYSGKYRYNSLFAFGGHAGVITDIGDIWKSYAYGEVLYVPWGDKTPVYRVCVQERLKISRYVEILGEYKREFIFKRTTNEMSASFQLLF
jgi:hypothetical protein